MKKGATFLVLTLAVFTLGLVIGVLVGRGMGRNEVTVYYGQEHAAPQDATAETENVQPPFLVNVNTASAGLLDTLPGIGPVTAQRIIDYRTQNGYFRTKADLLNVEGIGKETLKKIYDLITVEVSNENTGS